MILLGAKTREEVVLKSKSPTRRRFVAPPRLGAMVAQSEQALLAIAQGNASQGGHREDFCGTRRWSLSSSRAKATNLEQHGLFWK
jgi:hypothetical protein